MSVYGTLTDNQGRINLQASCSASSAVQGLPLNGLPHAPITCTGSIGLYDDGSMSCEHGRTPPNDERTALAVNHSIAMLFFEVLNDLGY